MLSTIFLQVSEDIDWTRKPVIGKVEAVDADLELNALLYFSIIGELTDKAQSLIFHT